MNLKFVFNYELQLATNWYLVLLDSLLENQGPGILEDWYIWQSRIRNLSEDTKGKMERSQREGCVETFIFENPCRFLHTHSSQTHCLKMLPYGIIPLSQKLPWLPHAYVIKSDHCLQAFLTHPTHLPLQLKTHPTPFSLQWGFFFFFLSLLLWHFLTIAWETPSVWSTFMSFLIPTFACLFSSQEKSLRLPSSLDQRFTLFLPLLILNHCRPTLVRAET